ncbi:putative phosphatase regulatory subunit-domain-containing protein [Entophlyctis helioformis]|nr:putative phosphatase regulatory subunit-domain-containing protein [Entophlyctis helioformis]
MAIALSPPPPSTLAAHSTAAPPHSPPHSPQAPHSRRTARFAPTIELVRLFDRSLPPSAVAALPSLPVPDIRDLDCPSVSAAWLLARAWTIPSSNLPRSPAFHGRLVVLESLGIDADPRPSYSHGSSSMPLLSPSSLPSSLPSHVSSSTSMMLDDALDALAAPAALVGSVLVRNIAFAKSVFVRLSTDGWRSFSDLPASFVSVVSPSMGDFVGVDRFSFALDLNGPLLARLSASSPSSSPPSSPSLASPAASPASPVSLPVEFAVCFQVDGAEHWDNNLGANYFVTLAPPGALASDPAQLGKQQAQLRSLPLRRPRRRSSLASPMLDSFNKSLQSPSSPSSPSPSPSQPKLLHQNKQQPLSIPSIQIQPLHQQSLHQQQSQQQQQQHLLHHQHNAPRTTRIVGFASAASSSAQQQQQQQQQQQTPARVTPILQSPPPLVPPQPSASVLTSAAPAHATPSVAVPVALKSSPLSSRFSPSSFAAALAFASPASPVTPTTSSPASSSALAPSTPMAIAMAISTASPTSPATTSLSMSAPAPSSPMSPKFSANNSLHSHARHLAAMQPPRFHHALAPSPSLFMPVPVPFAVSPTTARCS